MTHAKQRKTESKAQLKRDNSFSQKESKCEITRAI